MEIPRCPKCGSKMVLRTARQGKYAGRQFWGCSMYPSCNGIVNIKPNDDLKYETYKNTSNRQRNSTDYAKNENYSRRVLRVIAAIFVVALGFVLMHCFNEITNYSFAYGRKAIAGWIAFGGIMTGIVILGWHKR